MKIVDFKSYQKAVDKLDKMTLPTDKPINVFQDDNSLSKKMMEFFKIADGENQGWNI